MHLWKRNNSGSAALINEKMASLRHSIVKANTDQPKVVWSAIINFYTCIQAHTVQ